ncbi:MAG: hypothetical protein IPG67_13465 [Acidobacteria bacterium]|nr:hypothetical protein [Acidobacteriota bacterium]
MMVNKQKSLWLRNLVGLGLLVSLFVSSSMVTLAAPGNALSGEITVSGSSVDGMQPSVSLNGEKALSGRTFFTSGTISTPEGNSATINLGKLGRITMSPNSSLSLNLSENSISGDLAAGQIRVLNNEGVAVNIRTNDNVVTNDANAGNFSVDVTSGTTAAESEVGNVSMANGQPAAAKMTRRQGWIVFGVVAAIVGGALIIYYGFIRDDDVVSPAR